MKEVLISIKPKWCELIASGKKTIEVRKSFPKVKEPFKVYVYCTANKQGVKDLLEIHGTDGKIRKANGKVIGEFVCKVATVAHYGCYTTLPKSETMIGKFDLLDYADGKKVYGWHISDLVIYDEPKELSEFTVERDPCLAKLKRPPQSWCYVEHGEGVKE